MLNCDYPREYTIDEVLEAFVEQIRVMIDWWAREDRVPDVKEKLEGLAHSIFSILDGKTDCVGFTVTPCPHPSDKGYHLDNEECWYPSEGDIAGDLCRAFYWRPDGTRR